MEKIKKRIANLKVAGKLKVYQMTVLVMTLFLVLVALISTCLLYTSCDKRWTTEALTNIVKNAIEYSPDGSVIEIDSGENSMYSWISVKDSGMGMDKTEYARCV